MKQRIDHEDIHDLEAAERGQGRWPGWLLGARCQALSPCAARCAKFPSKGDVGFQEPALWDQGVSAHQPELGFPKFRCWQIPEVLVQSHLLVLGP